MTFGFDVYLGRYGVVMTIHEYTTESVRINRPGNTSVALHVFFSFFSSRWSQQPSSDRLFDGTAGIGCVAEETAG